MADPEQRERESAESEETKFEEAADRDAERRDEAADRLRDEPPLTPRDEDEA